MATKMKGLGKGIKYITHLFVVKEREIEIGFPTDVKHVAHIGLDGSDGSAPSWMNEFKPVPDSASSVGSSKRGSKTGSMPSGHSSRDPTWASQDFDQSIGRQHGPDIFNNFPPTNAPNAPKKIKQRKKVKSSSSSSKKTSSSPKSNSSPKSSSLRSSRARKSILGKETDNAEM